MPDSNPSRIGVWLASPTPAVGNQRPGRTARSRASMSARSPTAMNEILKNLRRFWCSVDRDGGDLHSAARPHGDISLGSVQQQRGDVPDTVLVGDLSHAGVAEAGADRQRVDVGGDRRSYGTDKVRFAKSCRSRDRKRDRDVDDGRRLNAEGRAECPNGIDGRIDGLDK